MLYKSLKKLSSSPSQKGSGEDDANSLNIKSISSNKPCSFPTHTYLLKRASPNALSDENGSNSLQPRRPYHQRLAEYIAARDIIFKVSDLSLPRLRPKRSTLRMREFYRNRKYTSRYTISTITKLCGDDRYYAMVSFLGYKELGLLDTGANVSCLSSDLAVQDFSKFKEFHKLKSSVKTADGKHQKVLGILDTDIIFKNQKQRIRMLIVPTLRQRIFQCGS